MEIILSTAEIAFKSFFKLLLSVLQGKIILNYLNGVVIFIKALL